MKIVVVQDGLEHSLQAAAVCQYAEKLDAEVIAVHALEVLHLRAAIGYWPVPVVSTRASRKTS